MSASKKKKIRQELAPEQLAELQQKQQQEEQAAKRSKLVYTIVGIATAAGEGGVAIVRMSGEEAQSIFVNSQKLMNISLFLIP